MARTRAVLALPKAEARAGLDEHLADQDAVCALQLGATPKIFQTIRPLAQPAIVLALAVSQPLSAAKAHTVHGGERVRLQARGPKENPRRKGERGVGMCGSLLTEPPLQRRYVHLLRTVGVPTARFPEFMWDPSEVHYGFLVEDDAIFPH